VTDETRVDAHVKVLDDRVVARARERGLDALVYAPHFTRLPTVRERAAAFSDDDLLVVPGREVFTGTWWNRKHVLGVGLEEPVPDFISFEGALRAFERQDAAVLVPHPGLATMSLDAEDVERHADAVDAVETYNAKCLPHQNRRAGRIADEHPGYGSSYAHLRGTVGEVWTAFDGEIADEQDLVAAFREERPRSVVRRDGLAHHARGLLEFVHLGYENTWEKIDRVLLSGMAPTHPDHIAYEGRFDDVRVY
jgi:predicted metal-dependent phosphoesterase TrpH